MTLCDSIESLCMDCIKRKAVEARPNRRFVYEAGSDDAIFTWSLHLPIPSCTLFRNELVSL